MFINTSFLPLCYTIYHIRERKKLYINITKIYFSSLVSLININLRDNKYLTKTIIMHKIFSLCHHKKGKGEYKHLKTHISCYYGTFSTFMEKKKT